MVLVYYLVLFTLCIVVVIICMRSSSHSSFQGVKGACSFAVTDYDYVAGTMVDVVHTFKEVVKKILNAMKGKRSVKDGKTDKHKAETVEARRRQKVIQRTNKQQARSDRKYQTLPVPPGSIRRAVGPFAHTGSLTINDIHRYIQRRGPGGYHLAASDLDDETLLVLIDYLWAIDDLTAKETDPVVMQAGRVKWLEILARAEKTLPAPEIEALVNHHLLEIWDQVVEFGSAWSHWTYIFERFLSRLVRKITLRSGIILYYLILFYIILYYFALSFLTSFTLFYSAPETSMAANWALSTSVGLMREHMRPAILETLPEQRFPRGTAGYRVRVLHQKAPGMRKAAASTPSATQLREYRSNRAGHHKVTLDISERIAVAKAVSSTKVGRRRSQAQGQLSTEDVHPNAFRFSIRTMFSGFRRSPAGFDKPAKGKVSCSAAFLFAGNALELALPRANQHSTPVVGEILDFGTVKFNLGAHEVAGLPTCLARVRIYDRPLLDSDFITFGYKAFDNRRFYEVFLAPEFVGPPVGIVRSPRLHVPSYVFWVIETHSDPALVG
jgi:hypothetical protein